MSNSNIIYGLFLFTGFNIVYSLISENIKINCKEIKHAVSESNKDITNKIHLLDEKMSVMNISTNCINKNFSLAYKMISNLEIKIDNLLNSVNNIHVYKIDKSTSTTELLNNNFNDSIIVKNIKDKCDIDYDLDLIDDVYDYLPCQNFKKQTVYDILLHNLVK